VIPFRSFLLLTAVLAVLVWSAIHPHDTFTWFLETFPGMIGIGVLLATYRKFRLTDLAYTLIAIHIVILCVGGHYTYAEVPFFNWVRDTFHHARNNYDKIGHFWQGFGPAIVAREIILRTSSLKRGKWLFFLVLCFCLALSAAYELLEWGVAAGTGTAADAFLGSQGDVWDTQKDMATCAVGALAALLSLSGAHDRQLDELKRRVVARS
jgi:putative membrane protein